VHQATIAWGKERAKGWLQVLNDCWLGPDKPYLCGDRITIADYFGASLLTLGEVIRCDFSAHPNVQRWLANMKRLPSWPKVNEALYGFAEAVKDQKFDAI
jgi:glutathione S-transferase